MGKAALAIVGIVLPVLLAYSAAGHLPGTTFPVIALGATAFSLMALNLLVATRAPGVDRMFGGLDQVYFAHKWFGILALACAFLHQQIKISTDGKEVQQALSAAAVEVAEIAFPVLLVLVLISFFKRLPKVPFEIPYQVWRWSHRLLGVVFAALAFHQFFVKAPFDNNALLATHLNVMAVIGLASYGWTIGGPLLRRRKYTVTAVTKHAAATIVDLEPVGKGIDVRPGGFAFVSFGAKGLGEPHPFTVSEVRPNGGIQFSIRGLGDFTKRVRDGLLPGDVARVEGGYGRFDYRAGGPRQVWVAAGIGITPFLSFADSLPATGAPEICLVYCVRTEAEGVGLDRLRRAAERTASFTFKLHVSEADGRFDAARLVALVPFDITGAALWFCGPAPLRVALAKGLKGLGKSPRSMHFERFEFR